MFKRAERSSSILDSTTCEDSRHLKYSPHLNLAKLGPTTLLVSHSEMVILLWEHWILLEIILWNKSSSQNGFKWCCWAVSIFFVLQVQDYPCLDTGYVLVSIVPLQHWLCFWGRKVYFTAGVCMFSLHVWNFLHFSSKITIVFGNNKGHPKIARTGSFYPAMIPFRSDCSPHCGELL